MGDRREDDLSAIAWPGFVDILSATVIMFVFFLLVVASVLFFHMIIFKSTTLSYIEQNRSESTKEQEEVKEISQMDTQFAESEEQEVRFDVSKKTAIIFFGSDSISVNPETLKEFNAFLTEVKGDVDMDRYYIHVIASKSPETFETAARKIALARMLNVRNVILKNEYGSASVVPKIVKGYKIEGSYDWISVEFKFK